MKNVNLGNFINGHNNNLDAIRLLAVILILFYHSFTLLGATEPINPFFDNSYGRAGIDIFLFISGFLIIRSFLNNENVVRFLWARFLRIFPVLIIVVTASVFILGPLVTNLSVDTYFKTPETYSYLINMTAFVEQYHLPGVFLNNDTIRVNGPLWILRYFIMFYIIVALLGITRLLKRRVLVLGLFILSLVLTYLKIPSYNAYFQIVPYDITALFTYFSAGMVAYFYRESIPLRIDVLIFVIIIICIGAFNGGFPEVLFVFPLGYLVLFFGYSPNLKLTWLTKYGDFSYGIYITHFPVLQSIIHITHGQINTLALFLISLPISYLLAALSWYLVEKRMLRLKDRYRSIFRGKTVVE